MSVAGAPALPGGAEPDAVAAAVAVLGDRATLDAPLGASTTYRVGGRAAIGVVVSSVADVDLVAEAVRVSSLAVLVIGRGSNMLVADGGFAGVAVRLDPEAFSAVTVSGSTVVVDGAVPLPALARRTAEAGLTGMEWAVGVPGSVGGGVRMNAGGHGSQMANSVRSATVADLSGACKGPATGERPRAALSFGYRTSSIAVADLVLAATLELEPGDRDRSLTTIRDIVRWRRDHQPGGQNAGSVFTNPGGVGPAASAGWLIDDTGLRGLRHRSAAISSKHANFIQADAGGSADDVAALMDMVRERVADRHGIVLHAEVRMIGFGPRTLGATPDPQARHEGEVEG